MIPKGWSAGTGEYGIFELAIAKGELITNGGFETGTQSDWRFTETEGTITVVSTDKYNGTYSAKMVRTTGTAGNQIKIWLDFPIVLGKKYKFSFWNKGDGINQGSWSLYDVGTSTYYQNYVLNDNTSTEWKKTEFEFTARSTSVRPQLIANANTNLAVLHYDDVSIVEIPPLPNFFSGTKYLECTSNGTLAIPSKQAYGTWEFDFYHENASKTDWFFIANSVDNTSLNGYGLSNSSDERFKLQIKTSGTPSNLISTALTYAINNTWYRIKVTRTLADVFTVYIKGGTFGTNNWTLVVAETGTNPATDNTYTTSNFCVLDLDVGDRITNFKFYSGIKI